MNQQTDQPQIVGPIFKNNTDNKQTSCVDFPAGRRSCLSTPKNLTCRPWQLTKQQDNCLVDNFVNESLSIAGADFHVYKLLGTHEQGKLVDVTGKGQPISGGSQPGFLASNAFDIYETQWNSIQTGTDSILASSYIGYDFGFIKTNDNSRRMYSVDTSVRKHIMAFSIKQSNQKNQRVTKARLERSTDGSNWYGVQIVNLPDNNHLNTILSKSSVTSRYWRLRPLNFNGKNTDRWGIQALQLYDNYQPTNVDNIQDKILLENTDRDYDKDYTLLKGYYDIMDVQSELTRYGIELPSLTMFCNFNFSSVVEILGRPLIVGDIVTIPSQAQFSPTMNRIEKWLEVIDVSWGTDGFTPGWVPTLLRIVLQPAFASQETQDLFGDLAEQPIKDQLGLLNGGDGQNNKYQDYSDVSKSVVEQAQDQVPQMGAESSGTIREWTEDEIQKGTDAGYDLQQLGQNRIGFQTEDAMPPNNADYSEGETFPTKPKHGDYHRMTYGGLASKVPARLFRYSNKKSRWVFLEADRRQQHNSSGQPVLQDFLTSKYKTNHKKVTKDE